LIEEEAFNKELSVSQLQQYE